MSLCENIDGQCGASWCDCDYQRRKRDGELAPAAGSACSRWMVEAILPNGLTDRHQVTGKIEWTMRHAKEALEAGASVVLIIPQPQNAERTDAVR